MGAAGTVGTVTDGSRIAERTESSVVSETPSVATETSGTTAGAGTDTGVFGGVSDMKSQKSEEVEEVLELSVMACNKWKNKYDG